MKNTDLYTHKLQLLQREFIHIKKNAKWKFEPHQQAVYEFVVQGKKEVRFEIKGDVIVLRKGNEDFGFMHLMLRHYGDECEGGITALDILKMGNVIKSGIEIPAKKNRIKYIQNKNNEKYTIILSKKGGYLIFTFFSSKNG